MHHSEHKCAYFCSKRCILGYGTGTLWDLWIWSIEQCLNWTGDKYWDIWENTFTKETHITWFQSGRLKSRWLIWLKQNVVGHSGMYRSAMLNRNRHGWFPPPERDPWCTRALAPTGNSPFVLSIDKKRRSKLHYNDISWVSWRLKSQAIRQFVEDNIKENIEVPHYGWLVHSPHY